MPSGNILLRTVFACAAAFLAFRYYVNFRSAQNALPFKVMELHNRGKGLVATRDIMQGEVILKETPLFVIKTGSFKDLGSHIHSIVSGLNSTSRSTFFELSYPSALHGSDIPIGIFQTNSLKVGDDAAGIFPLTARINHGCSKAFNSVYSWREGYLVLHALKHIQRGEVLLPSCPDLQALTPSPRRYSENTLIPKNLKKNDDLNCTKYTPLIVHAAYVLYLQETQEVNNLDVTEAVRLAKRVWALGEKEGYWGGFRRGRLGEDVVDIAAAYQDTKATQQWAELTLEWYSYELGYDSKEADRMRVFGSDPSKHPDWGTREKLLVGGPDMVLM